MRELNTFQEKIPFLLLKKDPLPKVISFNVLSPTGITIHTFVKTKDTIPKGECSIYFKDIFLGVEVLEVKCVYNLKTFILPLLKQISRTDKIYLHNISLLEFFEICKIGDLIVLEEIKNFFFLNS